MKYFSKLIFAGLAVIYLISSCSNTKQVVVTSPNIERDRFVDSLMSLMTLEEKIGQLNLPTIGFDVTGPLLSQDVEGKIRQGKVGAVFNTFTPIAVRKLQDIAVNETRLKIPLLFGYDVIHGHRTIFPIPLGLSSSWDLNLIERTAYAASREATADGLNWVFSPMVDIARDPRWGRVSEGAGEDVYLGSRIAEAMVKGYQGKSFDDPTRVMACIKHFALYGAAEAGRDYNTVDMSAVKMYNEYLPPYKAAIDAGAATVMSSFNEINGVPASGNHWLMTELLRNQWGFKGFVVTDYTAINEMIDHGTGDEAAVAKQAIEASVEMDMVGELFLTQLPELVKSGRVKEESINKACRLILNTKYDLGLFKNPYKYIDEERSKVEMMSDDKLKLSREAAVKSMVLLKNDNNVLPLTQDKKIAFIGPFIDDQRNLIGNWSGAGDWKQAVSIRNGLNSKFGADKFLFAKGCNIMEDEILRKRLNDHDGRIEMDSKSAEQLLQEAIETANKSDIVVVALGETFGMSGEAACRTNIGLLENQKNLLKALVKTGKPIVLVLMNGRPLDLSWENENVTAILETWFAGTQAGNAITDILFGDANPSGKITMTFPRNVGQVPIYYNAKNTGRPFDANDKYTSKYLDVANTPLYPFGHGLSYTKFEYSNLKIDKSVLRKDGKLSVSVEVKNTGDRSGEEIVQVYTRDLVGSITRPVKELKKFIKLKLDKGEKLEINFTIDANDLAFYNSELKLITEPGDFELFVGPNSDSGLKTSFKFE